MKTKKLREVYWGWKNKRKLDWGKKYRWGGWVFLLLVVTDLFAGAIDKGVSAEKSNKISNTWEKDKTSTVNIFYLVNVNMDKFIREVYR